MACNTAAAAAANPGHSDASIQIPEGQFGGLWRVDVYSDARIRLLSPQLQEQSSNGQGASEQSQSRPDQHKHAVMECGMALQSKNPQSLHTAGIVYKEIPAHKYVLKAGSSYFRGLLTTGEHMAGAAGMDTDERAAKRARVDASQGSSRFVDLLARHEAEPTAAEEAEVVDSTCDNQEIQVEVFGLTCNSEEEANATEAVIEFMHNHKLPAAATIGLLCKMIIAADYLGADLCVKGCAIGLSKLPMDQHSIQLVCDIVDKVRSCPQVVINQVQDALWDNWDTIRSNPGLERDIMKPLYNALFECRLDAYTEVLKVINDNGLLVSFCRLPLRSIELWGSSDILRVDSEDTVVALLNSWWYSQPHETRTDECAKKLSALVRPALLSSGYLHFVLDKLNWFMPPFPDYKYVCSVVNAPGVTCAADDEPLNRLDTTKRLTASQPSLHLQLRVSLQQMQQLATSSTGWWIESPNSYWQGHTWSLRLDTYPGSRDVTDGSQGSKISVAITRSPANLMPNGFPTAARIAIQNHPFKGSWGHCMFRDYSSRHEILQKQRDSCSTEALPHR